MQLCRAGVAVNAPKYPEVEIQLLGQDGNAFMMIGRTMAALRRHGVPSDEIKAFSEEAMSGDYDHVIQTILAMVSVS